MTCTRTSFRMKHFDYIKTYSPEFHLDRERFGQRISCRGNLRRIRLSSSPGSLVLHFFSHQVLLCIGLNLFLKLCLKLRCKRRLTLCLFLFLLSSLLCIVLVSASARHRICTRTRSSCVARLVISVANDPDASLGGCTWSAIHSCAVVMIYNGKRRSQYGVRQKCTAHLKDHL